MGDRAALFLKAARGGGGGATGAAMLEAAGGAGGALDGRDAVALFEAEVEYVARMTRARPDREAVADAAAASGAAFAALAADGEAAELSDAMLGGLEAVIVTNGERPVAYVIDDFVDSTQPAIAKSAWLAGLEARGGAVRRVCAAVGRLDDPSGSLGYQGTCWVIDDDLVMTNAHVLRALTVDGTTTGALKSGIGVDFAREIGAERGDRRFAIESVVFVGGVGAPAHLQANQLNFDSLDAAVFKIARNGRALPAPLAMAAAGPALRATAGTEIYCVGYPGAVGKTPPEVFERLFTGLKGYKRLAPGLILEAAGALADDPRGWIMTHDATTLGGNSGSAVVDLEGTGDLVLGLHFGGVLERRNWAHALERVPGLPGRGPG